MIEDEALQEALWQLLRPRFERLIQDVRNVNPDIPWQYKHFATDIYPFVAYASAMAGPDKAADELLVISVQIAYTGGYATMTADIARYGRFVLTEVPTMNIMIGKDQESIRKEVINGMEKIARWLEEQTDLVQRELASGSRMGGECDSAD